MHPHRRNESGRNNRNDVAGSSRSRGFEDAERYLEERAECPEWVIREW
jgi:hypothetical protein